MKLRNAAGAVCFTLLGVLSACTPTSEWPITGFENAHTPAEFWAIRLGMPFDPGNQGFRDNPDIYKLCVGKEWTKISPPELTIAVQRFLKAQNEGNYMPLFPLAERFSSEYEKKHGGKPLDHTQKPCLPIYPDDAPVTAYAEIHNVEAFWTQQFRLQNKKLTARQLVFKQCAGSEMVRISPMNMTTAIDRLLRDPIGRNYKALAPIIDKFLTEYEMESGASPAIRVLRSCGLYAFNEVNDLHGFWLWEVQPMHKDQPPILSDCIAGELTAITPLEMKTAILNLLNKKSNANLKVAMNEITSFGGKFKKETKLAPAEYHVDLCKKRLHL